MKQTFLLLCLYFSSQVSAQQTDSTQLGMPLEFNGTIGSSMGTELNAEHMYKAFQLSFGVFDGTKVLVHSADSLSAISKINFEQDLLVNRDATRGPISFKIGLKATPAGVQYKLFDIEHTGNVNLRMGPKSFGALTTASSPEKVPGTTYKSRKVIWNELKDTLEVNVKKRLLLFQEYMHRTL